MSAINPPACRPTDPAQVGAASWAVAKAWADAYPHLKPCPRAAWAWAYRSSCVKCPVHSLDIKPDQAGGLSHNMRR